MRWAGWLLAFAALATGCATPPPPSAYLTVEVSSGLSPDQAAPRDERVHVILDLTESVQRRPGFAGRADAAEAAREAATQVLTTLPPETRTSLRVLGLTPARDAQCTRPLPLGGASDVASDLASLVPELGGGSEAPLWRALEPLAAQAPRAGPLGRVVIVSDFGEECARPRAACEWAERLVAEGAELDLVVVGDRPLPACWRRIAAPSRGIDVAAAPPPEVRVEWTEQTPLRRTPRSALVPAQGRLELPAGAVRVIVALDPPEVVGPLLLPEGAVTRVRVLDFPALSPPAREVFVDTVAESPAGSRAP